MGLKVTGIKETKKFFQEKLRDTRKAIRKSLKEAGQLIANGIRARAPVLTGTLSKNIVVRSGKRRKGVISVDVKPAPIAWYGRLVETGHIDAKSGKFVPAHPFVRPVYDADKEKAAQIIIDSVEEQIKKQ